MTKIPTAPKQILLPDTMLKLGQATDELGLTTDAPNQSQSELRKIQLKIYENLKTLREFIHATITNLAELAHFDDLDHFAYLKNLYVYISAHDFENLIRLSQHARILGDEIFPPTDEKFPLIILKETPKNQNGEKQILTIEVHSFLSPENISLTQSGRYTHPKRPNYFGSEALILNPYL